MFTLDSAGSGSLAVRWLPPADTGGVGVDAYVIRFRQSLDSSAPFVRPAPALLVAPCGPDGTSWADNVDSTARCAEVGGLKANTAYDFEVFAQNSAGEGSVATLTGAATGPPMASRPPRHLWLHSASGGSITLRWDAPFDTGGIAVHRYVVQHARPGEDWTETNVDVGADTVAARSITLGQLPHSTEFHVRVAAHNLPSCLDLSEWTPFVAASTTPPSPPGPVTGVVAVQASGGAFTVLWKAPTDTGGSPVLTYQVVFVRPAPVVVASISAEEFATAGGVQVGGLVHSTVYPTLVVATNSIGLGPADAIVELTTGAMSHPSEAASVTATALSGGAMRVDWDAPADTGGSPVPLTFTVHLAGSSGLHTCTTTSTTCTVAGLVAATPYDVSVAATNAAGTSAQPLAVTVATTQVTAPTTPSLPTVTPSTPTCSATGAVTPPCNPSGGAIKLNLGRSFDTGGAPSWRVLQLLGSDGTWRTVHTGTQDVASMRGLSASLTYAFRQAVVNSAGSSPYAATVHVATSSATKPGPMVPATAVSATGGSICLSWGPPADLGGAKLVAMFVYQSTTTTTIQQCHDRADSSCRAVLKVAAGDDVVDGTTWTTCVQQLQPSTVYRFRLGGNNAVGNGTIGGVLVANTQPATLAGPPRNLRTTNVLEDAIEVAWDLPADNGGASQTSFQLGVTPSPADALPSDLPPSELAYRVTGLTSATEYTIRVRVVTIAGQSPWSVAVVVTTSDLADTGAVSFAAATWDVLESDGGSDLVISVTRHGGTSGSLIGSVSVLQAEQTLADGTTGAIPDSDFELVAGGSRSSGSSATALVSFGDGESVASLGLFFVNDAQYQATKTLKLCLPDTSDDTVIPCLVVNILDDGDAGVIGLDPEGFIDSVYENSGDVMFKVVRLPGCVWSSGAREARSF